MYHAYYVCIFFLDYNRINFYPAGIDRKEMVNGMEIDTAHMKSPTVGWYLLN